jgi:hypothetical protein
MNFQKEGVSIIYGKELSFINEYILYTNKKYGETEQTMLVNVDYEKIIYFISKDLHKREDFVWYAKDNNFDLDFLKITTKNDKIYATLKVIQALVEFYSKGYEEYKQNYISTLACSSINTVCTFGKKIGSTDLDEAYTIFMSELSKIEMCKNDNKDIIYAYFNTHSGSANFENNIHIYIKALESYFYNYSIEKTNTDINELYEKHVRDYKGLRTIYQSVDGQTTYNVREKLKKCIHGILEDFLEDMKNKCETLASNNLLCRCITPDNKICNIGDDLLAYYYKKLTKQEKNDLNKIIPEIILLQKQNDISGINTLYETFPEIKDISLNHLIKTDIILGRYIPELAIYYPRILDPDFPNMYKYIENGKIENSSEEINNFEQRNSKHIPVFSQNFPYVENASHVQLLVQENVVTADISVLNGSQDVNCVYILRECSKQLTYTSFLNICGKDILKKYQRLTKDPTILYHEDILCFGHPTLNKQTDSKTILQNDALYKYVANAPIQLYLLGMLKCSVTDAKTIIQMYKACGGGTTNYMNYIRENVFINPAKSKGGGGQYISIAGRRRKIHIQNRKQYVNYKSELILVSKLKTMIKLERHTK